MFSLIRSSRCESPQGSLAVPVPQDALDLTRSTHRQEIQSWDIRLLLDLWPLVPRNLFSSSQPLNANKYFALKWTHPNQKRYRSQESEKGVQSSRQSSVGPVLSSRPESSDSRTSLDLLRLVLTEYIHSLGWYFFLSRWTGVSHFGTCAQKISLFSSFYLLWKALT